MWRNGCQVTFWASRCEPGNNLPSVTTFGGDAGRAIACNKKRDPERSLFPYFFLPVGLADLVIV